jgi:monofunctional biosynthetic peptidoglycan transglycosylase
MKVRALLAAVGFGVLSLTAAETNSVKTLFQFTSPVATDAWQVVNDGVMGGVSRSTFASGTNHTALFCGLVSLENNGGFASVRSQPEPQDLRAFNAFSIRVRGDGRIYKFTARTETGFDSVLYQTSFTTKAGEWTEHRFTFADLTPTFRGRVLADAPKFNAAKATSVGFLIADRQAGPFKLEVEWIKATSGLE